MKRSWPAPQGEKSLTHTDAFAAPAPCCPLPTPVFSGRRRGTEDAHFARGATRRLNAGTTPVPAGLAEMDRCGRAVQGSAQLQDAAAAGAAAARAKKPPCRGAGSLARVERLCLGVQRVGHPLEARREVGALRGIPGVGPKTAERILVDLRDRIGPLEGDEDIAPEGSGEEAISAIYKQLVDQGVKVSFSGYDKTEDSGEALALIKAGELVDEAVCGETVEVITATTPCSWFATASA